MKFWIDQLGIARARSEPSTEILAGFLESDLQSPSSARRVIDAVDRLRTGQQERWERTGNAYTVILEGSTARLEDDLAEIQHAIEMPLDGFRAAVLRWLKMIEG